MRILRSLLSPFAAVYDRLTGPWLVKTLYERKLRKVRKPRMDSLVEARSILVVRLDEIGDAVMTVPMLRGLRASAPNAQITLVVKPPSQELFTDCPYTDKILPFEPLDLTRTPRIPRTFRLEAFARLKLQTDPPDFAFSPRWDADIRGAAILAYLSGASRVVGYSEQISEHKSRVNRGQDRLLTDAILPPPEIRHEVERSLSLLGAVGGIAAGDGLELWPSQEDRNAVMHLLQPGVTSWIALGVSGGNSVLKAWPTDRFVKLARCFPDCGFVLVGGAEDRALCEQVARGIEGDGGVVVNAAATLTLPRSAALLALCNAYVGSDSGPMHLAAAAGIPVVSLFGSSCPHRFRPWILHNKMIHVDLVCGPCHRVDRGVHEDRCHRCIYDEPKCMHSIEVEEVKDALTQALLEARSVTPPSA